MAKQTDSPLLTEPLVARNTAQLGAALLRFRKSSRWTQKETGDKAGIKQSMVSQIESGAPGTRLATLFKLLAGLDLELTVRPRRKT